MTNLNMFCIVDLDAVFEDDETGVAIVWASTERQAIESYIEQHFDGDADLWCNMSVSLINHEKSLFPCVGEPVYSRYIE
jgi:hypothetical protein